MRLFIRFMLPLVGILALLVWGASLLVNATFQSWFEKDLRLRAQLVVNGAREGIAGRWRDGEPAEVERILTHIARDERIMAAAVCDCDAKAFASTPAFPTAFGCETVAPHVRKAGGSTGVRWRWEDWDEIRDYVGGRVHVSGIPLIDRGEPIGFVILIQDMSFAGRREAAIQRFTLIGFAILALVASLLTVLVARFTWRSWTAEMRRFLRTRSHAAPRPEFQPLVRDLRELVAQISTETYTGERGMAWTAERLRQTLRQQLHGERIAVVANREPYIHVRAEDGGVRVRHPASGLVTALEPVMRACSGVWVAHGSGSADRETADASAHVLVPPGEESYVCRRVWLTPEQERGYYYGFSNEGLWPLCHVAHARPIFREEDFRHYSEVNRLFTEAVCSEVEGEDPVILVQDYHFALAPRMIRERLPKATVLTFWHIPWPSAERFGICPWAEDLIQGMLGSSIVGFHTQQHCNNFLEAVDRYLEARIDREQQAVVQRGRPSLVRAYPISIEFPSRWAVQTPAVDECRKEVFRDLGLPPTALLGVGVDRLDYTKGIEERLLAVERLLERHPELCGRFVFAQLAAPSRTAIERYQALNTSVESLAARINARFEKSGYHPIILLRRHHEPITVFTYYRAADVCYVSSLHDGMNLVAKEFVSARDDERGVLVLSRFTGAARELTEALLVNPYDIEEASEALAVAVTMPVDEQRERMRPMRLLLREYNVYRWAGRMLVDAARLRSRYRISDRLSRAHLRISNNTTIS